MNGHICLYKFINIGNLMKSYTPSFYQFCFVGRMELEGDTLFFTLHASALFQFLPSNTSYFSMYRCSVGVDTVPPWSPSLALKGSVLWTSIQDTRLGSRLAAIPCLGTAPSQCPSCALIHQTFSSHSDFQIRALSWTTSGLKGRPLCKMART